MPPSILALRLTLVQSNSTILIGSLDSTAFAAIGVKAVAARAARPNKALVTRNLLMDDFLFLAPEIGGLACCGLVRCRQVSWLRRLGVNAKPKISWHFVDLSDFSCQLCPFDDHFSRNRA